ncbi:MAG: PDZ domain-containing protein [Vicinamibacterales bacterium]|jgi:S1-C subfamily serine protease|nr:PDZ domain-containing protein [Vicinamibacterales bacterium]
MSNRRFQVIAGALTAVVLAAAAWLSPALHGQTRVTPVIEAEIADALDQAMPRVERVIEMVGGRGSEIGVAVSELPEADLKAGKAGVTVGEVREDGPAATAGFKAGDVVTVYDGEKVRGVRHFARLVQETPAGRPVKVQVLRDAQTVDLSVTPDAPRAMAFEGPRWQAREPGGPALRMDMLPRMHEGMPVGPGEFDVRVMTRPGRLGVGVQELTPELAEYFGVDEGVLVTSVTKESAAARAGIKAGDVITTVDGASVDDTAELRRRIQKDEDASEATIGLVRDRKPMTVKVVFDAPKDEAPSKPPASRRRV